jgi:hypothetical protein
MAVVSEWACPLLAHFMMGITMPSRCLDVSSALVVLGMTIKGLGCSAFLNEIEWNKKGVCLEVGGSSE